MLALLCAVLANPVQLRVKAALKISIVKAMVIIEITIPSMQLSIEDVHLRGAGALSQFALYIAFSGVQTAL